MVSDFPPRGAETLPTAKNKALYSTLGMSLLRVRIAENGNWSSETANSAAAHAAGVKVFGSPWSPPTEWNSNGSYSGGDPLPSNYGKYVSWLNSAASSIGLDYVSIQNEPENTSVVYLDRRPDAYVCARLRIRNHHTCYNAGSDGLQ